MNECAKRGFVRESRFAQPESLRETYEEKILERLRDILWPPGDPDRQWSADTICEIADELVVAGYGPKKNEKR